jgi:hypothetical protein
LHLPSLVSEDTVRWVLSNGGREVSCIVRQLDVGSELAVIYYDGLPLGRRVCRDELDASRWADEHRSEWEARGFKVTTGGGRTARERFESPEV